MAKQKIPINRSETLNKEFNEKVSNISAIRREREKVVLNLKQKCDEQIRMYIENKQREKEMDILKAEQKATQDEQRLILELLTNQINELHLCENQMERTSGRDHQGHQRLLGAVKTIIESEQKLRPHIMERSSIYKPRRDEIRSILRKLIEEYEDTWEWIFDQKEVVEIKQRILEYENGYVAASELQTT